MYIYAGRVLFLLFLHAGGVAVLVSIAVDRTVLRGGGRGGRDRSRWACVYVIICM